MLRALLLISFALAVQAFGQLTPKYGAKPVHGRFLVNVDDHATIFLNGNKVFHGNLGSSRSPDCDLKAGDQIVVHLTNDGGPRHFLLVFEAEDGKSIASFKATDFRVVPEIGLTNFTPTQVQNWTKPAHKQPGHKGLEKIVKNYSDWVWGDLDRCILACSVTEQMFSQRPK